MAEDEYVKTGGKTRNLDKYNERCVFKNSPRKWRFKESKTAGNLKKNVNALNCPANKQQNRAPLCQ